MVAFATHEELAARWRPLSSAEQDRARVLLEDASAEIRETAKGIDARIASFEDDEATGINPLIVKRVACQMVKRVMTGGVEREGISQFQEGTGPFTEGMTFSNPNGELYLTKAERKLLGVRARAFSIDPTA